MNREDIALVLSARAYAYKVFRAVFGEIPSRALLEEAGSDAARTAAGLFVAERDAGVLDGFFSTVLDIASSWDDHAEAVGAEHTRLFVGPGKLSAEPWESVYVGGESALFQKSTLEVRRAYVAEGFIPAGYPHVADDHIAIELDFMGSLALRMLQAYGAGDHEAAIAAGLSSQRFLDEHLLEWLPSYAGRMAATDSRLYSSAAASCLAFARADRGALSEFAAMTAAGDGPCSDIA